MGALVPGPAGGTTGYDTELLAAVCERLAGAGMVRRARAAGFVLAEQLPWGAKRTISRDVSLEVVAAQRVTGLRVNNYVFTVRGDFRVFFGGETRDLEPLRRYRQEHELRPSAQIRGPTLLRATAAAP